MRADIIYSVPREKSTGMIPRDDARVQLQSSGEGDAIESGFRAKIHVTGVRRHALTRRSVEKCTRYPSKQYYIIDAESVRPSARSAEVTGRAEVNGALAM